jgi:hypothetical protein
MKLEIADIQTEVRTERLPNTSHERYRYVKMFGVVAMLRYI